MRPRVILHNGVSIDGRMDWFAGDIGLYYELAARFGADAILAGSQTMLAAYQSNCIPDGDEIDDLPAGESGESRPLLAIVDSRGQIHNWRQIRSEPYWRGPVAVCSRATPATQRDHLQRQRIDTIVAGEERVDLRVALESLANRYGVQRVRVDSGGTLNGALLRAGLVDEVSLLVDPTLIGGMSPRSMFVAPDLAAPDGVIHARLSHVEQIGNGSVWLRYEIVS